MRNYFLLFLIALTGSLGSACTSQQPQAPPPAQPTFEPTATVREIMQAMVAPKADVLWNAVATEVSEKGTQEKAPSTDEEWTTLHHEAMILVEATNLIQIQGRHVANAGEKAQDEKIELSPEQIEVLINQDQVSWRKYAHGLHDAAMVAIHAIESKDAEALSSAGDGIDKACEECHLQYWYPKDFKK